MKFPSLNLLTTATVFASSGFATEARVGDTASNKKHGVSVANVYKNIRSLMGEGNMEKNAVESDSAAVARELEHGDPTILRCFIECIEQQMTADECQTYIEDLLGGPGLPNHEIPNLQIKISPPRTVEHVAETYWLFGVPTNLYGEVDCGLRGGNITYPWGWMVDGVALDIPVVPCAGLMVNECCDKVYATMMNEGIPLIDDMGNCFSCWPHQEPLEPILGDGGEVVYLEHTYSTSTEMCQEIQISQFDVQSADASTTNAINGVVLQIDALLSADPAECADLEQLHRDLLMVSRANTQAMSRIPGMLCGLECDGTFTLSDELRERLEFIRLKLTTIEIKSDENCIIIYTDRFDNVIEPPKIGGSREGLDIDLEDDCDKAPPNMNGDGFQCPNPNEMPNPNGTGVCICADLHVRDAQTGLCVMCELPLVYLEGECVLDGSSGGPGVDPDDFCAMCQLPTSLSNLALVTELDADIAADTSCIGSIAVGGTLKSTTSSGGGGLLGLGISVSLGNLLNIDLAVELGIDLLSLGEAGVDFDALKCLAQSIASTGEWDPNAFNVYVLTQGGVFDNADFCGNLTDGEENGRTLVVFNTSDDVTITKTTVGGKPFGPSILAPFSKVTVQNAAFVDGWVVAREFISLQVGLELHGDGFAGPLTCAP